MTSSCGTGDPSAGSPSGTTTGSITDGSECSTLKPSGTAGVVVSAARGNQVVPGGINTSWPAADVVRKLADFVDHHLREHDYDGHGWEELQRCRDTAYAWLASLKDLPVERTDPKCPRCGLESCAAAMDWNEWCSKDEENEKGTT